MTDFHRIFIPRFSSRQPTTTLTHHHVVYERIRMILLIEQGHGHVIRSRAFSSGSLAHFASGPIPYYHSPVKGLTLTLTLTLNPNPNPWNSLD